MERRGALLRREVAACDGTVARRPRPRQAGVAEADPPPRPRSGRPRCRRLRPALVHYTDQVLFGQVWKRPELAPRERSLVTVAALTTSGNTDQLVYHLGLAKDNGATEQELIEALTHLAFYTDWPKAMAAMTVAMQVFRGE